MGHRIMPAAVHKELSPFYLRRASGEKLCPKRLEKSLIKHIKRSFRGVKDVKPASTLCIFVPPAKVLEGASLHFLLSAIERSYGSSVTSFFPNCFKKLSSKVLESSSSVGNSRVFFYSEVRSFPSIFDLINYSVNRGVLNCREAGIDLPTLLPFTLTDIIEGFIEFMIFQHTIEGLGVFSKLLSGSTVLLPFKEVPRSDILAYAYSKKLIDVLNSCPIMLSKGVRHISDAIAELEVKHSELLYSSLKSLKQLIKAG